MNKAVGSSIGAGGIIFIVLFVLKILGYNISWWVVTLPLWLPIVLTFTFLVLLGSLLGIYFLLAELFTSHANKQYTRDSTTDTKEPTP